MNGKCRVAGARDAGPVAIVRDERQIVRVTGGATQPVVQLFSCAGMALGAFVWSAARLAAFAWTHSQALLTLDAQGQVLAAHGRQKTLGLALPAQWLSQVRRGSACSGAGPGLADTAMAASCQSFLRQPVPRLGQAAMTGMQLAAVTCTLEAAVA